MMVPTLLGPTLGASDVVEAVKAAARLMQDAAAPQADKDAARAFIERTQQEGQEAVDIARKALAKDKPFYKRAWFWGTVGVVTVAGVGTAFAVTRRGGRSRRRRGY